MKVLLVRFSAIGDCVMAAHTASCVRRTFPEGTLVWAVEERCAPVVDDEKLVTAKAVYPRERWKKGAWSPRTWREQLVYHARLRSYGFDIGIDLQGHSKTAICLKFSRAKRRLSVRATDPVAKRLNPLLTEFGGAKHTVERQLYALRTLGDFPGDPAPMMPSLATVRPELRKLTGEGAYVVIAVGAGKPWKAYPSTLWRQISLELEKEGVRVVILGGPEERELTWDGSVDLVGRLSLEQTMAAVAESSLILAADTGAGHLAAAYGVPVVSIFGPTDPEEFRPYTEKGVVLKEGDETKDVKPEQVIEAALRFWRADGQAVSH